MVSWNWEKNIEFLGSLANKTEKPEQKFSENKNQQVQSIKIVEFWCFFILCSRNIKHMSSKHFLINPLFRTQYIFTECIYKWFPNILWQHTYLNTDIKVLHL